MVEIDVSLRSFDSSTYRALDICTETQFYIYRYVYIYNMYIYSYVHYIIWPFCKYRRLRGSYKNGEVSSARCIISERHEKYFRALLYDLPREILWKVYCLEVPVKVTLLRVPRISWEIDCWKTDYTGDYVTKSSWDDHVWHNFMRLSREKATRHSWNDFTDA